MVAPLSTCFDQDISILPQYICIYYCKGGKRFFSKPRSPSLCIIIVEYVFSSFSSVSIHSFLFWKGVASKSMWNRFLSSHFTLNCYEDGDSGCAEWGGGGGEPGWGGRRRKKKLVMRVEIAPAEFILSSHLFLVFPKTSHSSSFHSWLNIGAKKKKKETRRVKLIPTSAFHLLFVLIYSWRKR